MSGGATFGGRSGLRGFYRQTSVCRNQSSVCFHTLVKRRFFKKQPRVVTFFFVAGFRGVVWRGGAFPGLRTLTCGSGVKSLRGQSARLTARITPLSSLLTLWHDTDLSVMRHA